MKSVKNPFHSLKVVMLLVFLCFMLLMSGLVRIIYNRSAERFEETLIQTIQTETRSYANSLEQELQAIHMQTYSVLSDSSVSSLSVRFEVETQSTSFALRLSTVQSHIQAIQNGHNIIDSMEIYYPQISRKVTNNSQMLYTEEECIKSIISQSSGTNVWNDSGQIVYWNASPRNRNASYETMKVIIVSVISADGVRNYLNQYKDNELGASFAVFRDGGEGNSFFVSTSSSLELDDISALGQRDGYSVMETEEGKYLLTWLNMEDDLVFYQFTPFNQVLEPMDEYKNSIGLLQGILVGVVIVFTLLLYRMIYRPIAHARQTFLRMKNEGFGVLMGKTWYREFQGMYSQFDSMSKHIQQLIEQEYELHRLNSKAQMKQLQYQISPHFLYNTYFTLQGLLQEEEYEKAIKLSDVIGRYLRYITISDDEDAPLMVELEHAQAYAQIQEMRFEKRISIRFVEVPKELRNLKIPRLVLQPLVENAFDHGVRDKLNGGFIQVRVSGIPGGISVCVEDNGDSLTEEKLMELSSMLSQKNPGSGDSIALFNIHRRLVLRYGEESGLFVSRSQLGGLRCELRIVFAGGDDHAQDSGG